MIVRCGPTRAGVLMAVLHQDRPTIPSIALEVGVSTSTVNFHVQLLKRLGIVAAEPGTRGTLRPLVEYIPVGQS